VPHRQPLPHRSAGIFQHAEPAGKRPVQAWCLRRLNGRAKGKKLAPKMAPNALAQPRITRPRGLQKPLQYHCVKQTRRGLVIDPILDPNVADTRRNQPRRKQTIVLLKLLI
jgi:hypothetical protein